MSAATLDMQPRVWIGSLSAYNAGRLIGEWVDATDLEAMEALAARLPGEEIALMDREGFGDLIGEYTSLGVVAAIGGLLGEHGDAFRIYCEYHGLSDLEAANAEDDFEESYRGDWGTGAGADFAENLAEELGAISSERQWPLSHIDWDAAWNELTHDGYWEKGGHVFG